MTQFCQNFSLLSLVYVLIGVLGLLSGAQRIREFWWEWQWRQRRQRLDKPAPALQAESMSINSIYTLLIWEIVPERTDLFLIPHDKVDKDVIEILRGAHKQMVNVGCETDCAKALNLMCASGMSYKAEHGDGIKIWKDEWSGLLHEFKLDISKGMASISLRGDHTIEVVLSGFYC